MTQGFQMFTKRYVNVLGVFIGVAVVSSILLYSGCGMTSRPNTPASPTPTPTPTPDTTPPTSTITSPTAGASVSSGTTVSITGTASDTGGGTVARVEVSVDGGTTFNPATGTTSWSFNWTPTTLGPATIKSRAIDSSGNQQNPPVEVTVTVRDATPPTSTIGSPKAGAIIFSGTTITITGNASDAGGGRVARVEVSVNGGATYSAADFTGINWFFDWTPNTPGPVTIKSRAVDDSGNQEDPPAAVTVMVPIRVPSDVPTIQSAINVASDGDMVLVAPGTYSENIDFKGKAITVTSESGPQDTIIDGGNAGSVVRITSGAGRGSALNGFTLQNGSDAGIRIAGSPTITNNVIKNNLGCLGGGIGISGGSPLIQLNTITNNDIVCVRGEGAGISMRDSSAEILDNVISDNGTGSFLGIRGGGIFILGMSPTNLAIVKRNIIKGNSIGDGQGGGINMEIGTKALIVQNLITGNQAGAGGGIYSRADNGVSPIVNNTIADNTAIDNGSGIYLQGRPRTELTNNIIVANPGRAVLFCNVGNDENQTITRFNNIFSAGGMAYGGNCSDRTGTDGNISADPLFTDPAQGDYHLKQGSPSIDAGDNLAFNLPDKDLDGDPRPLDGDGNGTAIIDMGVDEFRAPPSINISLLDESNRSLKNSRALFICDLRPWARTPGGWPINTLSALPPRSPRLRVKL